MNKLIITLSLTLLCYCSFQAQTKIQIQDFKLGESLKEVKAKGHQQIGFDEIQTTVLYRYKLEDRNAISVTLENDEVVYIEMNHLNTQAQPSGFLNFTFKNTKLKDIRDKFNSEGFLYTDRNSGFMDDYFYTITCYEIKNSDSILAFITNLPTQKLDAIETHEELLSQLELTTVILAKVSYLDSIWQEDKTYPDNKRYILDLE